MVVVAFLSFLVVFFCACTAVLAGLDTRRTLCLLRKRKFRTAGGEVTSAARELIELLGHPPVARCRSRSGSVALLLRYARAKWLAAAVVVGVVLSSLAEIYIQESVEQDDLDPLLTEMRNILVAMSFLLTVAFGAQLGAHIHRASETDVVRYRRRGRHETPIVAALACAVVFFVVAGIVGSFV